MFTEYKKGILKRDDINKKGMHIQEMPEPGADGRSSGWQHQNLFSGVTEGQQTPQIGDGLRDCRTNEQDGARATPIQARQEREA